MRVIKALALGARAVSFARPYLYGLAAGGSDGVRASLRIMRDSLTRDMALAGLRSSAEITPDMVVRRT